MTKNNRQDSDPATKHPEKTFFQIFLVSALLFMSGIGTVVYVNLYIEPSHMQETLAILGLCIAAPAALGAIYGYLRLLLVRLSRFKNK